jgi:hypothetical protein
MQWHGLDGISDSEHMPPSPMLEYDEHTPPSWRDSSKMARRGSTQALAMKVLGKCIYDRSHVMTARGTGTALYSTQVVCFPWVLH